MPIQNVRMNSHSRDAKNRPLLAAPQNGSLSTSPTHLFPSRMPLRCADRCGKAGAEVPGGAAAHAPGREPGGHRLLAEDVRLPPRRVPQVRSAALHPLSQQHCLVCSCATLAAVPVPDRRARIQPSHAASAYLAERLHLAQATQVWAQPATWQLHLVSVNPSLGTFSNLAPGISCDISCAPTQAGGVGQGRLLVRALLHAGRGRTQAVP